MRAAAIVVVAVLCCQAVAADTGALITAALVKGALVKGVTKGAKQAVLSSAGAGAGFAAGALSGLPVTTFDQFAVPANFTKGQCKGNGFCFPKYRAALVEKPTFRCGDQFSMNDTKLGPACIRHTIAQTTTCFKSVACPASGKYTQSEEVCLPTEVRGAMIGMLAVFKVRATLPFIILPALKAALAKALLAPVVLPKALLLHMVESHSDFTATDNANSSMPMIMVPELDLMGNQDYNITITHPADIMKLAFEEVSQAGEGVVKAIANGSCNPMELVTKGILNVNMTDLMQVVPQIDDWVSAKLEGLTHINQIVAALNSTLPSCMYRCCRPDTHKDTSLHLPTPVCRNGTSLNKMLGLCVGGDIGYAPCPVGFQKCMLPSGVPLCTAQKKVWGMESCKVAGVLMHNLPKHQCPYP